MKSSATHFLYSPSLVLSLTHQIQDNSLNIYPTLIQFLSKYARTIYTLLYYWYLITQAHSGCLYINNSTLPLHCHHNKYIRMRFMCFSFCIFIYLINFHIICVCHLYILFISFSLLLLLDVWFSFDACNRQVASFDREPTTSPTALVLAIAVPPSATSSFALWILEAIHLFILQWVCSCDTCEKCCNTGYRSVPTTTAIPSTSRWAPRSRVPT